MNTPEQLIQVLKTSPLWDERRRAALALGHAKTDASRKALMNALNVTTDEDVLHGVILALGETGNEDTVDDLLRPRFLNHPNSNIRWAALQTIRKIGHFCRIPDIADMTEDSEWIVRNEAFKLIRTQTESILEHCSPESARRLSSLLVDSNQELYGIIVDALLRIGPRFMPFLRDVLRTGGKRTKVAIAYVLGQLSDKKSIPLLIELLESNDKDIRKCAVEALGQIGDLSAAIALIETLGDPVREVRNCTVSALARIGKPAVPAIHEKLQSSSRKLIQQNALFTLAKIRDTSSIPHIIEHLGSTYFIVRRAAISGLVQFGEDAIELILDVIRNVKLPMLDNLLLQAECGETINIRVRAIEALGALADHRAVHLLKNMAASTKPAIQKNSLKSLAQVGCSCWQRCGALAVFRELRIAPDVDLIIEQLNDDSENVRWRAIQVLARGGNVRGLPGLLNAAVNDPHPGIRCEALRGADELAPADAKVVECAREILNDSSAASPLLAEAARIIGRSPDEKHIAPLVDCLKKTSWEVRRNAALALGNIGEKALPALMKRLESTDELELESVIRAIGNAGASDAVPVIEGILAKYPENSPVHYAAQKALSNIKEKAA